MILQIGMFQNQLLGTSRCNDRVYLWPQNEALEYAVIHHLAIPSLEK